MGGVLIYLGITFLLSSLALGADATPSASPSACTGAQVAPAIDVSDHQPDTDWATVHSQGIGIAIVKATEGVTFVNPTFSKDWESAKQAGLVRGAYHFFTPTDDGEAQAYFFVNAMGPVESGLLPAILDWEVSGKVPNALVIKRAQLWLETIAKVTQITPMIYTSPTYWKSIGSPSGFEKYPLFIADYLNPCPEVPAPWSTWAIWQHGIGTVAGISQHVDLDLFNFGFAGLLPGSQN